MSPNNIDRAASRKNVIYEATTGKFKCTKLKVTIFLLYKIYFDIKTIEIASIWIIDRTQRQRKILITIGILFFLYFVKSSAEVFHFTLSLYHSINRPNIYIEYFKKKCFFSFKEVITSITSNKEDTVKFL